MDTDHTTKIEGLDTKIKTLVFALVYKGFRTFASCQGGEGHSFPFPIVRMLRDKDKTVDQTRERLAKALIVLRLKGFHTRAVYMDPTINLKYMHRPDEDAYEKDYVEVEFWSIRSLKRMHD